MSKMMFIPDITKEWPAMFLGAEVKGFHEHPEPRYGTEIVWHS